MTSGASRLIFRNGATLDQRSVLLVGTTGAGKTSVLRQLIGTDPDEQRFPTTATGRTTIADTEFILGGDEYSAVITFFPLDEISQHPEDCVLQAVLVAYRNEARSEKQALFDDLANRFSERMMDLARERTFELRHQDWIEAFGRSGHGSTGERARIIDERIYATTAPIPSRLRHRSRTSSSTT